MTEHEWKTGTDLWALWRYLSDVDRLTDRKKRLFCAAVVRRVVHLMTDERSRRMIDACEVFADGGLDPDVFLDLTDDAFTAAGLMTPDQSVSAEGLAAAAAKWLGCDDYKVGRAVEFSTEAFGWQNLVRRRVVAGPSAPDDALRLWHYPNSSPGVAGKKP